jgi:hypothetical protein
LINPEAMIPCMITKLKTHYYVISKNKNHVGVQMAFQNDYIGLLIMSYGNHAIVISENHYKCPPMFVMPINISGCISISPPSGKAC